jgi:hypothetical protein
MPRNRTGVSRVPGTLLRFIGDGPGVCPELRGMDRPDHRVFWIECVAPCLDQIVKIRTVEVRSAIHALLLLLAPAFRHRHVEGD